MFSVFKCFFNLRTYFKHGKHEKQRKIKFIYSEKATIFLEISPLLLFTVHTDNSKGEISQNFGAFSEYMNFTNLFLFLLSSYIYGTRISKVYLDIAVYLQWCHLISQANFILTFFDILILQASMIRISIDTCQIIAIRIGI